MVQEMPFKDISYLEPLAIPLFSSAELFVQFW